MRLDVLRSLLRVALMLAAFGLCSAHGQTSAALAFEDSMAQRSLACTHCHGVQGRAAPDGYYPRIAGKPAGYLYNQLLHFREGRRHYGPMTQLLDPLSQAYLMEVAQHFAALQLPYPPPVPSRASKAVLERGRQLVREGDAARQVPACAACHGQQLTGVLPQVPGLLGLPRDYLNAQLGAWRTGKRRAHAPDCMAAVAKALDIQDIEAVSSWLAAQPMPVDSRPAAAAPPGRTPECGTAQAPIGDQR
jgi:cytochrome c553